MVAQKGRNYLLKYNTTGSTYVAAAGIQENSIEINNEPAEATNADSAGVRTLLEGAGVTSVSIKAKGVYVNDTVVDAIRSAALTNTHKNFQLIVPGASDKTIAGSFMIQKFTDSANFKEAGLYDIQLESAGAITIT